MSGTARKHRLPLSLLITLLLTSVIASGQGPTDAKAQKTYADAVTAATGRDQQHALDLFRKAGKQDGMHCVSCAAHAADLALKVGDWKLACDEARQLEGLAKTPEVQADAHYKHGLAALHIGINSHKDGDLAEADTELREAIRLGGTDKPVATYADGLALAYLHQDEAARARFHEFADMSQDGSLLYTRASRFEKQPELARAKMAPPFALTTLTGQRISLDDLGGKVLLIDFWATWCGPCREALPRVQNIAKKFAGQPLVVLSVSLDKDEAKWKEFVAKNNMTWPQYCDGGFEGSLAQRFAVHAIPATFTIDADGVLQDQHVGDAAIEGKLKKLIAEAASRAEAPPRAVGN